MEEYIKALNELIEDVKAINLNWTTLLREIRQQKENSLSTETI